MDYTFVLGAIQVTGFFIMAAAIVYAAGRKDNQLTNLMQITRNLAETSKSHEIRIVRLETKAEAVNNGARK